MMKLPSFKIILAPKKKTATVVGLDIGTSAIKMINVKSGPLEKELLGFISQPVVNADFTTAIKNATTQVPLETNKVNVAVSGSGVVIRCVNIPKMNATELASAMRFEAEKHIMFPLDEVIYDTQILEADPKNNTMLVLIAAAKKDVINSLIKRLNEANLEPSLITIDSLALARAYFNAVDNVQNNIVCLVNIGATFSNLVILDNGLPKLSRDINFGLDTITRKISEALNVTIPEAEELKCYSPSRKDEVMKISEPLLATLASEIRDSLDFFETQNNATVAKIVLSGGGAKLSGLPAYLKNTLGIEIDAEWDPFIKFKINPALDSQLLKNQMHKFAIASGLVSAEINLLPPELKETKKTGIPKIPQIPQASFVSLAKKILIGLLAVQSALLLVFIFEKSVLAGLNQKLNKFKPDLVKVNNVKNELKTLEAQARFAGDLRLGRGFWSRNLSVISESLPKGIWLRKLSVSETNFQLEGSVACAKCSPVDTISGFLNALKKDNKFMATFSELELVSVQKKVLGGMEVADFLITGKIRESSI